MYLHSFLYGDKCKYIDFRDITNLQVRLLFLVAGLLEDKARDRAQSMFTFFSNPLLCLKQEDFKITQTNERKESEDCIKVCLILKLASCFKILTIT